MGLVIEGEALATWKGGSTRPTGPSVRGSLEMGFLGYFPLCFLILSLFFSIRVGGEGGGVGGVCAHVTMPTFWRIKKITSGPWVFDVKI